MYLSIRQNIIKKNLKLCVLKYSIKSVKNYEKNPKDLGKNIITISDDILINKYPIKSHNINDLDIFTLYL